MPKKFGVSPLDPLETYPDPISEIRHSGLAAELSRMTDKALGEDVPASRLFASLPADLARDVKKETDREREIPAPEDPSPRA